MVLCVACGSRKVDIEAKAVAVLDLLELEDPRISKPTFRFNDYIQYECRVCGKVWHRHASNKVTNEEN